MIEDVLSSPDRIQGIQGFAGSGKTTTLMMLAGFETPTGGEILLEGRSLSHMPPHQRNIGMVFQNYALFPHMTVAKNIAYAMRSEVDSLPVGQQQLSLTIAGWRQWAKTCALPEFASEECLRSALCLKLLTYAPTGAIVAAPTTSLPETTGGERKLPTSLSATFARKGPSLPRTT